MLKKLFIGIFGLALAARGAFAAPTMAGGATARPSMGGAASAVSRGPLSMAAASGIKTAGMASLQMSTASAVDANCSKEALPDQISLTRCIQKYMACTKQDSVCGEHYESCDSKNRFKQKMVFCQDKLMECSDEGITAIFGNTLKNSAGTAAPRVVASTPVYARNCEEGTKVVGRNFTVPSGGLGNMDFSYNSGDDNALQDNMIAQAIADGRKYASSNAVNMCRSVADGCIKRACQNAPHKCMSSTSLGENCLSDGSNATSCTNAVTVANNVTLDNSSKISSVNAAAFRVNPNLVVQYARNTISDAAAVKSYLAGQCKTDIGASTACYLLINGKAPKSDDWTIDDFEINNVYSEVMTGTLNRMNANSSKILEWFAQGVGRAIDSCKAAATDCIKTACGSGSLAACYGLAIKDGNINIFNEDLGVLITNRCAQTVNANQNCRDIFASNDNANTGESANDMVWDKVLAKCEGNKGENDSQFDITCTASNTGLGLVGQLNNELASMFNETTVRNLRKQCQAEAESCVRRECGNKFQNCYINDKWLSEASDDSPALKNYGHTVVNGDGTVSATDNAAGGFDEVMAQSLCLIPVKKLDSCQNYFDIQYAKLEKGNYSSTGAWAGMSQAWDSSSGYKEQQQETAAITSPIMKDGVQVGSQKSYTKYTCNSAETYFIQGVKNEKDLYDYPGDYKLQLGSYNTSINDTLGGDWTKLCTKQQSNIFLSLISDIAATARAQLTKEQNLVKQACEAHKGQNSLGDTYLWAKKPSGTRNADNSCKDSENGCMDRYETMGIVYNDAETAKTVATADLWGAFCRVKVGLTSTDPILKRAFQDGCIRKCDKELGHAKAVPGDETLISCTEVDTNCVKAHKIAQATAAYFSLGDAIMCGSWLQQADLDQIELNIRKDSIDKSNQMRSWASKNAGLIGGVGGAIVGMIGGGILGHKINESSNKKKIEQRDQSSVNRDSLAEGKEQIVTCRHAYDVLKAAVTTAIRGNDVSQSSIVELTAPAPAPAPCKFDGVANAKGSAANSLNFTIIASSPYKFYTVPLSSDPAQFGCEDFLIIDNENLKCVTSGGLNSKIKDREDSLSHDQKFDDEYIDPTGSVGWDIAGVVVGGALLGTGGGFLAADIANRQHELEALKKADADAQAWFDNVGSKIQCTVGGKVVGSYGDMIELK